MKLWLLTPLTDVPANDADAPHDDSPWDPCYDRAFGFVVAAATEGKARRLAAEGGGEENFDRRLCQPRPVSPWLDPALSACVELRADGRPAGVVLRNFWRA